MKCIRVLGLWAALFSTLILPATASAQPLLSSAQRLANLEAAVSMLTSAVTVLQAENAAQATLLQSQAASISALNASMAAAQSSVTALQTALTKEIADRKTYADSVGTTTLASAKTYADGKVAPVADKLIHFSRTGNEVYITGANLNLRNGTGLTYQQLNGLGNLIVGYNELRTGTGVVNTRTGSHNVVLGFGQNYSQAGAFMSGAHNNSTNHFASVLGGTGNTSGGLYSVVVGGFDNQISNAGNWSTVLGGQGVRVTTQLAHVP